MSYGYESGTVGCASSRRSRRYVFWLGCRPCRRWEGDKRAAKSAGVPAARDLVFPTLRVIGEISPPAPPNGGLPRWKRYCWMRPAEAVTVTRLSAGSPPLPPLQRQKTGGAAGGITYCAGPMSGRPGAGHGALRSGESAGVPAARDLAENAWKSPRTQES